MQVPAGLKTKRAIAALSVSAVLAGGGAAVAAGGGGPAREAERVEADIAQRLGVSEAELEAAYEGAMIASIDRAVEEGRIDRARARGAREAIRSAEMPAFGAPPPGHFAHPGGPHGNPPFAQAAAAYLGITETELERRLTGGDSLARIAEDEGKAVAGLREVLLDDARRDLHREVDAGRLGSDQAQEMLVDLRSHLDEVIQAELGAPGAPGGPLPLGPGGEGAPPLMAPGGPPPLGVSLGDRP